MTGMRNHSPAVMSCPRLDEVSPSVLGSVAAELHVALPVAAASQLQSGVSDPQSVQPYFSRATRCWCFGLVSPGIEVAVSRYWPSSSFALFSYKPESQTPTSKPKRGQHCQREWPSPVSESRARDLYPRRN